MTKCKFYFRKHVVPLEASCERSVPLRADEDSDAYELFTVSEILMGKGESFPGLVR